MVSSPVAAWLLAKNRRRRIAATLAVAATPVTSAEIGTPYDGFTVTASGGQGEFYQYSIASGALPAGLTLGKFTGAVSGTPTTAGTYTAAIRVSDAVGNHRDTASFTITVSA